MSRQAALEDQRGFTLVELLITIVIMGIVLTIASSSWFGAIESRRVDSATNQRASDLRQAHSRATNRLADQTVTLTAGNSEYTVPSGSTYDLDDSATEDVVSVPAASTFVFKADGSVLVTGANPIMVRATNNPGNSHTIEINPVTSEIKVVP
jgi:prepilin-type N-terminal cleavage/methylation domain-containing protein